MSTYQVRGRVDDPTERNIDHYAVSVRYDDETPQAITIKPFVDEDTPHGRYGMEIPIEASEQIINEIEMAVLEVNDGL